MLSLENISFTVSDNGQEKTIIKDVTLSLPAGHLTVITGPNGGGKSTLARLIAGISKPTSGRILLNGVDITDKSITERANLGISYGFQQPPRFKGMKVVDLLEMAGASLQTVSMWSKKPVNIRILSIIASPLWLIYDLQFGSYIGMINETIVIISIIVAFIRYDIRHRNIKMDFYQQLQLHSY